MILPEEQQEEEIQEKEQVKPIKTTNKFQKIYKKTKYFYKRNLPQIGLKFGIQTFFLYKNQPKQQATKNVLINYLEGILQKQKFNFEVKTWYTSILLFFTILNTIFSLIQKFDLGKISSVTSNKICDNQKFQFIQQSQICKLSYTFSSFYEGKRQQRVDQICKEQKIVFVTKQICKTINSPQFQSYSEFIRDISGMITGDYISANMIFSQYRIPDNQLRMLQAIFYFYCILGTRTDMNQKFLRAIGFKNIKTIQILDKCISFIQIYVQFPKVIANKIRQYLKC